MAGPERERLSARAGSTIALGVEPLHLDARDRPGVGPGPRLDVAAGRDGLGEGAFEQDLREQRLGVDLGALAEQHEAGEGEAGRATDEARHARGLRRKRLRARPRGTEPAARAGGRWSGDHPSGHPASGVTKPLTPVGTRAGSDRAPAASRRRSSSARRRSRSSAGDAVCRTPACGDAGAALAPCASCTGGVARRHAGAPLARALPARLGRSPNTLSKSQPAGRLSGRSASLSVAPSGRLGVLSTATRLVSRVTS